VFEWHIRLKKRQGSLQGDELKGRPSASRREESTEVIQKGVAEDRTLSVRMLEEMTRISRQTVLKILIEFQEGDSWYILHCSAPAHSSGVVSEFLAKRWNPVLSHPSYSHYLAPADSLNPKLNIALKGAKSNRTEGDTG
jgi:hypothetical protein